MAHICMKRWLAYIVLVYVTLWVITAVHGPAKLQTEVFSRTSALSERIKKGIEQDNGDPAAQELAKEIAGGPQAKVDLLSCPIPFYFQAESKSAVGRRYQVSGTSWYIYTPWRLYPHSN